MLKELSQTNLKHISWASKHSHQKKMCSTRFKHTRFRVCAGECFWVTVISKSKSPPSTFISEREKYALITCFNSICNPKQHICWLLERAAIYRKARDFASVIHAFSLCTFMNCFLCPFEMLQTASKVLQIYVKSQVLMQDDFSKENSVKAGHSLKTKPVNCVSVYSFLMALIIEHGYRESMCTV